MASSALDALRDLFQWADEVELAYAWATASGGTAAHWKALDLGKVHRAVIGTQFAQTEPWALSELAQKAKELRVVITSQGTFHPKIAFATKGARFRALIGSSNLTVGGFSSNTELNVLIEGKNSDPQAMDLRRFLDEAWSEGQKLEAAWLASYEEAHRRRPRSAGLVPAAPVEGESLASLDMPWPTYVQVLRSSDGAQLQGTNRLRLAGPRSYLWELDQAQERFRSNPRFIRMPSPDKHFVHGRGASTGYFGHMGRALAAATAINERAKEIGAVLDEVPRSETISIPEAKRFVERLTDVNGFGLAVASRVLCVKRPDIFVSVNEANRKAFERLGYPINKSIDRYITLLNAVHHTQWYRSPEPADPDESRLWQARAAILDAAVYRG